MDIVTQYIVQLRVYKYHRKYTIVSDNVVWEDHYTFFDIGAAKRQYEMLKKLNRKNWRLVKRETSQQTLYQVKEVG